MNNLAVSLKSTNIKNPTYLVPNLDSASIKAGDHIDLVVEVYSYKGEDGAAPVALEATKWPTNVTVATGTKVADFPARIQADGNVADFTITGGSSQLANGIKDYMPITVEGFDSYADPKLEEFINGAWTTVDQSVGIKDFWQTTWMRTKGHIASLMQCPLTDLPTTIG